MAKPSDAERAEAVELYERGMKSDDLKTRLQASIAVTVRSGRRFHVVRPDMVTTYRKPHYRVTPVTEGTK